jgi:hypothetical protein
MRSGRSGLQLGLIELVARDGELSRMIAVDQLLSALV